MKPVTTPTKMFWSGKDVEELTREQDYLEALAKLSDEISNVPANFDLNSNYLIRRIINLLILRDLNHV